MSTNSKNVMRPEFLKNFTRKVKERYILLEKRKSQFTNVGHFVSLLNGELNEIIQDLNLKIHDRQLPYITLKVCYGDILNKKSQSFSSQ